MHFAHDYRRLINRWRAVARGCGLPLRRLPMAGRPDQFYLRTTALGTEGGIYLSAGIHGDEPAATEALVSWAEAQGAKLNDLPLLIFPCLNPWGLTHNSRFSEKGEDLNRLFHQDAHPLIAAVKAVVGTRKFAVALLLHEDYDGQGIYIYEIQRTLPYWGEALLETARPVISIEGRPMVDGRKATDGLIRRKLSRKFFDRIGYPEAIWLHFEHSDRTFTIETPSEFALPQRVAAHRVIIEESVRRVVGV